MKHYDFHFERKSNAAGAVIIEGFSNKNVPDRIKERMDPKGGRFENYKKNPIILFDHGKDPAFGVMPIGKSLVVEPQEQGVYTKARISNSKTEKITVVRDLVEEEILKTFSLGYETFNESKGADGTTILTDWELLEQSIVPVPMNQDSVFSLSKRYKRAGNDFGCSFLERQALISKGALVAAAVRKRIFDMQASKALSDADKALGTVAEMSGHKIGQVKEFMMGERHATPSMMHAFAVVLGVKESELLNLRNLEVKSMSGKANGAKDGMEKPPEAKPTEEQTDEQKSEEQKQAGQLVLHTINVPKTMFDEPENARGFVESHGFKADKMSDDDQCYYFEQNSAEGLDMEKAQTVDMGEGVTGRAAPRAAVKADPPAEEPKEETKPPETPPAAADQKPDDEKPDEQKEAATPQDLLRQALEVGDNHDRARQLVQQALTMLGDGKAGAKAAPPMPSGQDAVPQDDNPYLAASRQTNVLLGTLIQEIQKLGQKFDGMVNKAPDQNAEPKPDAEQSKRLADLRDYQHNIDVKLKRLGV